MENVFIRSLIKKSKFENIEKLIQWIYEIIFIIIDGNLYLTNF